ncbi:MAG: hypothetical protein AAF456_05370, partial [Planctomycetota bacterium]
AMKQELAADENREKLAAVSGVNDPEILKQLIELGVTPETLTSVSIIPLIAVAWSDGTIQDEERKAILNAANLSGIDEGTPAHQLLESWLAEHPGDGLIGAWKDYVSAFKGAVKEEQFQQLRDSIMDRSRAVAKAAGGFLGIGAVSESEEKVLEDLLASF